MEYNYYEAIETDVREYLENTDLSQYASREEAEENLYDEMWTADSVTGNGSGSYFFNTYRAEEALCHNLDLLKEAFDEFGGCYDVLEQGAEAADVTIRCYLYGGILSNVLDEYESAGTWDESETA